MPTPIQYPSFPPNVPLCSSADVNALLSQIADSFSIDDTLMANSIGAAKVRLESATQRYLAPKRIVQQLDGNGTDRLVLPYAPVLLLNSVAVYYTYPLGLTRVANDFDFVVDRAAGIISYPLNSYGLVTQPLAFNFYPSSKNITVDYTCGYSDRVWGETLSTADNQTYSFANPAVQQPASVLSGQYPNPTFTTVIYKNGTPLVNATYANAGMNYQSIQEKWQATSDNLYYSFVPSPNGGWSGIRFNTPNTGDDVITADYVFWTIPADIVDAAAKLAAITILSSIAIAPTGDVMFGGMTSLTMDGFRFQANDKGQFGPQMNLWQTQIDATIARYKDVVIPFGRYSADNFFIAGW